MSIQIMRNGPDRVVARTICDDCRAIIAERPAGPGEHPGIMLPVCDWCTACSPNHSFLIDAPWKEVVGVSTGNPNCLAKVSIET